MFRDSRGEGPIEVKSLKRLKAPGYKEPPEVKGLQISVAFRGGGL